MEYYEELAEGLFADRLLNSFWKTIAEQHNLSSLQKVVFYLYFGLGMYPYEVCKTLDILFDIFPELLSEIYDRFDIDEEVDEQQRHKLLEAKLDLLLTQYRELEYEKQKNIEITKSDIKPTQYKKLDSIEKAKFPNIDQEYQVNVYGEPEVGKSEIVFSISFFSQFIFIKNLRILSARLINVSKELYSKLQLIILSNNKEINTLSNEIPISEQGIVLYDSPGVDCIEFSNKGLIHEPSLFRSSGIPDTLNLDLIKSLFHKRLCQKVNFDSFKPILEPEDFSRNYAAVTWLSELNNYVSSNHSYFCNRFFIAAEYCCLQLNVDWKLSAVSILQECYQRGIAFLMAGQKIDEFSPWLRYALFASVVKIAKQEKTTDRLLTAYCNNFWDYPIEKRSLLDEEIIDDCMKNLLASEQQKGDEISDWSKLWKYAQYLSACTLSDLEIKTLENIHLSAIEDTALNKQLNFIEDEILSKVSVVDNCQKSGVYVQNWRNLKNVAFAQYELLQHSIFSNQNKHSFDLGEYISHQRANKFESCVNRLSFIDNIYDVHNKDLICNSLLPIHCENLSFDGFKNIVRDISFDNLVNVQDLNFNDQKVYITHYVLNSFKLSIVCWNGGQVIPRHSHGNKYDAIYVYRGTLKHIIYDDGVPSYKLIAKGNIEFVGCHIEHELANYSSTEIAVSVHVQWDKDIPSYQDIYREYPCSLNSIVQCES